ncbi:MAG: DUF3467 domain-containing protein [Phycisphaerales bacterium]|nr:DUF3467 domain-containing protein [Phycisphaerales bacterium]
MEQVTDTQPDLEAGQEAAAAPRPRVRVKLDEADQEICYINTFRTATTPEEFMLDVGVNTMGVGADREGRLQHELRMHLPRRLIMNYYTAKRLAISLGRVIREYEESHGVLELDPSRRHATGEES